MEEAEEISDVILVEVRYEFSLTQRQLSTKIWNLPVLFHFSERIAASSIS